MLNKAVFLDKDGTLIENVPYNVDPEKIVWCEGTIVALHSLHQAGYKLLVITNQSGIARGYFEEADLHPVKQHLKEQLAQFKIPLAGFYYCPHHPDGTILGYSIACRCRKPEPGLLQQAAADHHIDLSSSWFIGDILHDVQAGRAAGCRTVLIDNGNETEWQLSPSRLPHLIVNNLREAANAIIAIDNSVESEEFKFQDTDLETQTVLTHLL